ncbi:MAG: tRNA (N6-isopentenyl adenosine(37)-C2)-methylthiotransferase MiaB [Candidatus Marinimicrobia bacterium]|nr:tRNA (N6-isopentenyl adenosine(37)-C2)-methylthiotransferase MiaB [Candidatus Neomarinimicrobiota bacterium]
MTDKSTYHIETYGCEMNVYDSSLVKNILTASGLEYTGDKESADYLLINTCSVRDHAEQRVFSLISQYNNLKKTNPGMKIVLLGCMASRYREEILKKSPGIDLAVGPDGYRNLPEVLGAGKKYWSGGYALEEYNDIIPNVEGVTAGIAIARGCENYCSYCVVPYVRGRERSRPVKSIISEMETLAERGVKEVTLLGQNVNSYYHDGLNFPALLRRANEVDGIERIRFMTSHPKDCSLELLKTMADCRKTTKHLHLPFQAGSNRILKLMNRKYTREHYLGLIETARSTIPDISITTDIIAGFPSETEEDFEQTLDLVRRVGFDDAFTYRYSVREGTKASKMKDDVPEKVKIERLERLISLVRKISAEKIEKNRGSTATILIEHESKKDSDWWMGRTEYNNIAVIPKEMFQSGDFVKVIVENVSGFTLRVKAVADTVPIG